MFVIETTPTRARRPARRRADDGAGARQGRVRCRAGWPYSLPSVSSGLLLGRSIEARQLWPGVEQIVVIIGQITGLRKDRRDREG